MAVRPKYPMLDIHEFMNLNHVLKKLVKGVTYFLTLDALGYPKSVIIFYSKRFGSTSPSAISMM
jgi:hypothetical protein